MASAINPAYPEFGNPTTESVRDNFQAAKSEIEALQADTAALAGDVNALEPIITTGAFTVDFGGTHVGATFSVNEYRATQIGKLLYIAGAITFTAKGTSVGNLTLGGFGHTARTGGSITQVIPAAMNNIDAGINTTPYAAILPGATSMTLRYTNAGVQTFITDAKCSNTTIVRITGVIEVD